MGKTAWQVFSSYAWLHAGIRDCFFFPDMPRPDMITRLVSEVDLKQQYDSLAAEKSKKP
jgi:hypothetical protein